MSLRRVVLRKICFFCLGWVKARQFFLNIRQCLSKPKLFLLISGNLRIKMVNYRLNTFDMSTVRLGLEANLQKVILT